VSEDLATHCRGCWGVVELRSEEELAL